MDDDAEPRSLFVVVSYDDMAKYFCSILQLEPHVIDPQLLSPPKTHVIPTETETESEFSAHFSQPMLDREVLWAFSHRVTPTQAELYMVPDYYFRKSSTDDVPLRGGVFDLRTETCTPIKAPLGPKYSGRVAALGDHIYFMTNPRWGNHPPRPVFECYNTRTESWEELEPFPPYATNHDKGRRGFIVATVILVDTILLSIDGHQFWAYFVPKGQWYLVDVKQDRCYRIIGEAVALNDTIFAIPKGHDDIVLELSIKRQKINGDLVFTCYLQSELSVPGLKRIDYDADPALAWTRHLVHLGKDNFCLVQCCNLYGFRDYQHIQVTYITLKGKESTVTSRCVHNIKMPADQKQFAVRLCFSLPKSKTTVLAQGKRFFTVNPAPEGGIETPKVDPPKPVACRSVSTITEVNEGHSVLSCPKPSCGQKASTHGNDAERNDTDEVDEEGRSICVTYFPPGFTLGQLAEESKKLGPDRFRLLINNTGKFSDYVEFESAASEQRAVEASAIRSGTSRDGGKENRPHSPS